MKNINRRNTASRSKSIKRPPVVLPVTQGSPLTSLYNKMEDSIGMRAPPLGQLDSLFGARRDNSIFNLVAPKEGLSRKMSSILQVNDITPRSNVHNNFNQNFSVVFNN